MSGMSVQSGFDITRDVVTDVAARRERDADARMKLAAFALDQPNPQEWLVEMLDLFDLWPTGSRSAKQAGRCVNCDRELPISRSVRCWACAVSKGQ
jgi:hypothetical protein